MYDGIHLHRHEVYVKPHMSVQSFGPGRARWSASGRERCVAALAPAHADKSLPLD